MKQLPPEYRICERINENPFDTVFLGTIQRYKSLLAFRRTILLESESTRQFLLHAETVLAVSFRHPHIIQHLQVTVTPDDDIITVMPYYESGSLHRAILLLKQEGKIISKGRFFSYAYQLLMALAYLHRPRKKETYIDKTGKVVSIKKVIHGAIRPTSILLSNDRKTVYLSNFTNCQEVSSVSKRPTLVTSTYNPFYSSPEELLQEPISELIDIWSLGATLYELYTLTPLTYLSDLESSNQLTRELLTGNPSRKLDLSHIADPDVRLLLSLMLCTKPAARISVAEILFLEVFTPYFTGGTDINMNQQSVEGTNDGPIPLPNKLLVYNQEADQIFTESSTSYFHDKSSFTSIFTSASSKSFMSTLASSTIQSCINLDTAIDKDNINMVSGLCISTCSKPKSNGTIYRNVRKYIATRDLKGLLSMREDISKLPHRYPTVLYLASEIGWTECCKEFLWQAKRSVRHTGRGYTNPTALMRAARKGFIGPTQLLVEYEHSIKDTSFGKTALMLAAERNKIDVMKILIPYEAGQIDKQGNTALILATQHNNVDAVRLLCESESNIENRARQAALLIAVQKGNYEIARILAPYEGKNYGALAISNSFRIHSIPISIKEEIISLLERCMKSTSGHI